MTNIKLISVTPNAEETVGYCARVSNPANQSNPDVSGLLSFCIRHGHWSIFEMANMVVEIETTRGIAAQILRHRSFSFQEFSQRYAEAEGFKEIEPRRQDKKNRQNSLDDLDKHDREWFKNSLVEIDNDLDREKSITIDANSNEKRLKEEKNDLIDIDTKYYDTEKKSNDDLFSVKDKLHSVANRPINTEGTS